MVETLPNSGIEACRLEHEVLEHVKGALRVALDWKAPEISMPRKISSVRFTLESFQRHLERLIALEEEEGYMRWVVDTKPNLDWRIEQLRQQHEVFRKRLRTLLSELDQLADRWRMCAEVDPVCDEIRLLLTEVDQHDRAEIDLLQEALMRDEGGEG